jgi:hypothetical protein
MGVVGEELSGVVAAEVGGSYVKRTRLWLSKMLYALLSLIARQVRPSRVIN